MLQESKNTASDLTRRMAKAGSFGHHRQNVARDIFRALQLPVVTRQIWSTSNPQSLWNPNLQLTIAKSNYNIYVGESVCSCTQELFYVKVPIRDPADRKTETEMDLPLVLPHALYAVWVETCSEPINAILGFSYMGPRGLGIQGWRVSQSSDQISLRKSR